MNENLLTTRQAAQIANRNQRTVVSWCRKGWIAALKLPGKRGQYLIDRGELDQFLIDRYTPQPYEPEEK